MKEFVEQLLKEYNERCNETEGNELFNSFWKDAVFALKVIKNELKRGDKQ